MSDGYKCPDGKIDPLAGQWAQGIVGNTTAVAPPRQILRPANAVAELMAEEQGRGWRDGIGCKRAAPKTNQHAL